ncbi:ribosomal-processing cysteine protease Prp [Massiliimalia massiliensis]|jgi:uncharacterized protein YsxB (DUF464 family)|uniref:ribosomal-processing cysteine protease Prp n=1 Tax=Massiliimalia massiliensis TaxID=1852384 RepID=UPI000987A7BF|nr:ribosomal-processing cysteine protease Prp [Massiliimalia massiliensis]MBS1473488.1 ribosomal-processing cysteine protease Prp [Massiliimalia sp.]
MVRAQFEKHQGAVCGFRISGHAGYGHAGEDIVCASVSSALQMTANGITEILGQEAEIEVLENEIHLRLVSCESKEALLFLQAFYLQLSLLAEDYPNTIKITDLEV